ncbi:hypothetical protein GCM10025875_17390 [Litorihabitans aurantiacus]|uniref:Diaminopimelate epimerase n=1 Tax=Litorihabitans aurantiacus TaxID=1930061 RepID=A0AA37XEM7_9MICO|nr:hypothetical protein GCM10025875_17390 [Litorihabitans aurantiacus]
MSTPPAGNAPDSTSTAAPTWPRLVKGHGTGNDFLLLVDSGGDLAVAPADVARLTDRHHGVGADGLIRAVRTTVAARDEALPHGSDAAEWFMDYRNADGSVAEMCGNGIRVFVAFLADEGLVDLPDGGHVDVATRAGVLRVHRVGAELEADMGRWTVPGGEAALAAGSDVLVTVAGVDGQRPGLSVAMPNPHVVIAVSDAAELAAADLTRAPLVDPVPGAGTNVEIVWAQGEIERDGTRWGVISMRVHERGVGETLSCGTGACAAALAASVWAGAGAPADWVVHVPGGTLAVHLDPDGGVALRGPAQLVADVTPADRESSSDAPRELSRPSPRTFPTLPESFSDVPREPSRPSARAFLTLRERISGAPREDSRRPGSAGVRDAKDAETARAGHAGGRQPEVLLDPARERVRAEVLAHHEVRLAVGRQARQPPAQHRVHRRLADADGRVRPDRREAHVARHLVRQDGAHARRAVGLRVAAGEVQRALVDVDRPHPCVGRGVRERERDRPPAAPQVEQVTGARGWRHLLQQQAGGVVEVVGGEDARRRRHPHLAPCEADVDRAQQRGGGGGGGEVVLAVTHGSSLSRAARLSPARPGATAPTTGAPTAQKPSPLRARVGR